MSERHQWEYMTYTLTKDADEGSLHAELQSLGQQGWEVTTVLQLQGEPFLILKRTSGWG